MDQGGADNFLHQNQLLPEELVSATEKNDKIDLSYNLRQDYDHSYYFIATFMADHIKFHVKHLN